MRTAVLNSPLNVGGRRYVRGDKIDLTDEEYDLYSARGMCEPYVTKGEPVAVTAAAAITPTVNPIVASNFGSTYVQTQNSRSRRR